MMKTFTPWPTRFFRSTSCCSSSVLKLLARTQWKLPWYVWLCFYRALLVVLEEWRHEGETNILQCDNAQPNATKNSFNTSSIWVRWFCHCLSHVLKWCPTHGGPAFSFFLGCNSIWVEVILIIVLPAENGVHIWKASRFPYGGSTPSSKWSLCEGFHPQMANVTANVRIATHIAGLEVGSWKHEEIARVRHSCVKALAPRSARFVPLLSCDSSCVLAVCRDSMKVALAGSRFPPAEKFTAAQGQ